MSKFGSPEQIDVFVFLYEHPDRDWAPEQVGEALGMAPQSAGMRMFLLASAGLLAGSDRGEARYRYVPNPVLDSLARQIAGIHASRREQLYEVVTEASRPDPARQFADAFRLRKR